MRKTIFYYSCDKTRHLLGKMRKMSFLWADLGREQSHRALRDAQRRSKDGVGFRLLVC